MPLWEQKVKPMLAFTSAPFDDPKWIFEIKFDGTRCIAYVDKENLTQRFLNRRMVFFQHRYPELHISEDLKCKRAILDGEIVVFEKGRPDFHKLAERDHVEEKTRVELLSNIMPATYVVFDILYKDGKDLVHLALEERKQILQKSISESTRTLLSVHVKSQGKKFFQHVKQQKLEGIVAKKLGSVYEQKRSRDWLKIKALKRLDAIIAGYTTGTGKRGKFLGSLITASYYKGRLRHIGKVGTGFTEEEMSRLLERLDKLKTSRPPWEESVNLALPPGRKPVWVKPQLVCEVEFMQLTEDLVMRAPVYIRLRDDKMAEECELEADLA